MYQTVSYSQSPYNDLLSLQICGSNKAKNSLSMLMLNLISHACTLDEMCTVYCQLDTMCGSWAASERKCHTYDEKEFTDLIKLKQKFVDSLIEKAAGLMVGKRPELLQRLKKATDVESHFLIRVQNLHYRNFMERDLCKVPFYAAKSNNGDIAYLFPGMHNATNAMETLPNPVKKAIKICKVIAEECNFTQQVEEQKHFWESVEEVKHAILKLKEVDAKLIDFSNKIYSEICMKQNRNGIETALHREYPEKLFIGLESFTDSARITQLYLFVINNLFSECNFFKSCQGNFFYDREMDIHLTECYQTDQLEEYIKIDTTFKDGMPEEQKLFAEKLGEKIVCSFLHRENVMDSLMEERNRKMVSSIDENLLIHHSIFVTAGAFHFQGDKNILALLEEKGYSIKKIN